MSMPDQIIQLLLAQGELNAQQAREYHANKELLRQNKHRFWKNTLQALATFGPMFIPGIGPFGGAAAGFGQNVARNTMYGGPSQWGDQGY